MKLFYNKAYKKFFITSDNAKKMVNLKSTDGRIVNYIDVGDNVSFHNWSSVGKLMGILENSVLIPSNHGITSSKIRVIIKYNLNVVGKKYLDENMMYTPTFVESTTINNSSCGLEWVKTSIDEEDKKTSSSTIQPLDMSSDDVNDLIFQEQLDKNSDTLYSYEYNIGIKHGLSFRDSFMKEGALVSLNDNIFSNPVAYIDGIVRVLPHEVEEDE